MSELRVHGFRGDCVILVRRDGLKELGEGVRRVAPSSQCVLVAMDAAVERPWGDHAIASLKAAGFRVATISLTADETHKSIEAVQRVWSAMLKAGVQRSDVVVALGGGVIGDLAGFAAATFLRGISLVMAPTTLLAMVDAAIGGKTAVNLPLPDGGLGKNLAGAFHAPAWVLCDISTLSTLSDRDYRCGLAESVKHALIADVAMLQWIVANRDAIMARDSSTLTQLITRSATVKAAIVSRDEFERSDRAHLNLGHTFAHALEATLHAELRHGEAVALGLIAAVAASKAAGWWSDADPVALSQILKGLGLPTRIPVATDRSELVRAMGFDKKSQGGTQRLVLLRGFAMPALLTAPSKEIVAAGWDAIGA